MAQFCEAAGLKMCTVGLANKESPQDLADFVEYLYGGPNTHWGAIRAADGHPEPYGPIAIEISNESCMSSFNGTFAPKIAAMEANARLHGMGGKLRYVTGSYLGITAPSNHCPAAPNTTYTVFKEVAEVGLCAQLLVDTHITPATTLEGSVGTAELAATMQKMAASVGCMGLQLVVLEENLCHNHFSRALNNGGAGAGLQSIPTLAAAATSQCFQAGSHADGCGEGHIISMPDLTWAQPPFYASQMMYTNFLSSAVKISATPIALTKPPGSSGEFWRNLTSFALADTKTGELVLRFVNDNNRSVAAVLDIAGGRSPQTVMVQRLTSPLFGTPMWDQTSGGGWNSPANTTFISTVNLTWAWTGGTKGAYLFLPKSFTVLRFNQKSDDEEMQCTVGGMAGGDINVGNFTIAAAVAYCNNNSHCKAFTAEVPASTACKSTTPLLMHFKDGWGVDRMNGDVNWSSWTAAAAPSTGGGYICSDDGKCVPGEGHVSYTSKTCFGLCGSPPLPLVLPPVASVIPAECKTWYDTTTHGDSWVSAAAFGAKPDGRSDSTAAIQAAIDDKRGSVGAKRRATVYLPPGEYLVSDTILMWAATTFVGSSSTVPGCRSTLVLQNGATGFGDASALKPLLVTTDGYNRSAAAAKAAGWWHQGENANDVFFNQLHSVDLRLGANPGATGVLWHPAQGTSVRDLSIDARGAYR